MFSLNRKRSRRHRCGNAERQLRRTLENCDV
jgi:hypothetical protein